MSYFAILAAGIRDFGLHVVDAFREPIESSLRGRKIRGGSGRQAKLLSRESADHVVRGLQNGVRALTTNAVWPLIDLSSQSLHTAQYLVEVSSILSLNELVSLFHRINGHPSYFY